MSTDLLHLTLTSGDMRRSLRSEVGDDIVAMLRPLLTAGGGVVKGLRIAIEREGAAGGCRFDLGWGADPTTPDVCCVLCWDASAHATWWTVARALPAAALIADPAEPAAVPWLAVAIQRTVLRRTPQQMRMLGDAERCVAWAIMDENHG